MGLRRMLAFVLTVSMLMGNVTPAFAAESSVANSITGNVQITTDENGNTVITGISDETSDAETVDDEEGRTDELESKESDDETPSDGETTESESVEGTIGDGTEESGDGTTEGGTEESGEGTTEGGTEESGDETEEEETTESDEAVSDNDREQEEDTEEEETEDTVSDNGLSVSVNSIDLLNETDIVEVDYCNGETPQSFPSLLAARDHIVSGNGNTEQYVIRLLGHTTIEKNEFGGLDYPDDVSARVRLELNGYTLTVNEEQVIRVNDLDAGRYVDNGEGEGRFQEGSEGTLAIGEGVTLNLYPRSSEDGSHIWIGNLDISAQAGSLCIGEGVYEGNYADINNVTADVKSLTVYGGINWKEDGEVTVKEDLTVWNNRENQEARFGAKVVTADFTLLGGNIYAANFESTENTTVKGGSSFRIGAGGKAIFNNVDISETAAESFHLALEQKVALNSSDGSGKAYAEYKNENWDDLFSSGQVSVDEIFANATMESELATFTINGEVNASSTTGLPIFVHKNYCWDLPEGEDWQRSCGVNFDLENGETFATVSDSVSENMFYIEYGCACKYTVEGITYLKAAIGPIAVRKDNIINEYSSLEAAAEGIEAHFGGERGEYWFIFREDTALTDNVTLPECVTTAYFETDGYGNGEGDNYQHIGNYQKTLDLNGHTLETSARINLYTGLRITSNGEAGKGELKFTPGQEYVALDISEDCTLIEDDTKEEIGHGNVLSNVAVNAADREVSLYVTDYAHDDIYPMQDMNDVSLNVKELSISRGNWRFAEVTATNLQVEGLNTGWDEAAESNVTFAKATLLADNITIQRYGDEESGWQTGFMNVRGTVGSFDTENPENAIRPNLILKDAKLFIANGEESGDCYLNTLTVDTVYSNESYDDCTVENSGQFFVKAMNMKGSKLVNRGNMVAGTIAELGDFQNDHNASLICNTFEQQPEKQTEFMNNSRMLINVSGKLNNITAGHAVLGKGSQAQIQINGSFRVMEEDLKMEIAVTDSYSEIDTLVNEMTYFNPYEYYDKEDPTVILKMPAPGDKLFDTDMGEFPTENIAVLPWEQIDENGKLIKDENGNTEGNPNTSAYQYKAAGENGEEINEIQVSGEIIRVFALTPNGMGNYLKGFTGWKDAMNYLSTVGNINTKYLVALNAEEVDFGGNMNLPSGVARMEIVGVNNRPVVLKNNGKINLVTDTKFENVTFEESTEIAANGWALELCGIRSVTVNDQKQELETANVIAKIEGTDNSVVFVQDSYMRIQEVSDIEKLEMTASTLETESDISVGMLVLKNAMYDDTREGNPSCLNACGRDGNGSKMEIDDIIIYGKANTLVYGDLTIHGMLKSHTADGAETDYSNVFAVLEEKTETLEDGTPIAFTYYRIQEDRPTEDINGEIPEYVEVKRNAISLMPYTGGVQIQDGDKLAVAENIPSTWFVFDYGWREFENDETAVEIESVIGVTHKVGDDIRFGRKDSADSDIVLSMCVGFETVENEYNGEPYEEPIYAEIDRYETLQEAFDEIEKIGDSEQLYSIVLNSDVESETDFIFPSQAQCIWIEGAGSVKNIRFPAQLNVRSHIDFKNVNIEPEAEIGTLNIDEYRVTIIDSKMKDDMAVVGNGGNSELHAASSEIVISTLENVDILSAFLNAKVTVKEDIEVKTLWLRDNAAIYGLGAIKVTDIESYGSNTIVTIPTIKKTEEEYDRTVISEITSNLAISGNVKVMDIHAEAGVGQEALLNIELGKIEDGEIIFLTINDFAYKMMWSDKAVIAKAPMADTGRIVFNKGNDGEYNLRNYLYKKNGNIVCKYMGPEVELSYETKVNGESILAVTPCVYFADAIEEINNLKTKRNYTIRFLDDVYYAKELKFPNKDCVDTLTLTSAENAGESESKTIFEIWYIKDITLTCNVDFKDIDLVQTDVIRTASGNSYKPVSKASKAVKINTGGNNLTFSGDSVRFNTPIALDGGNKGTLNIDESTSIITESTQLPPYVEGQDSYLLGTISKFAQVSVSQRLFLDGFTASNGKYVPAEINVTALTIHSTDEEQFGDITVGHDGSTGDKVKVNDLTLNGANLYVYGDAEFKNVTFAESAAELWVYGQKFNITGVLTSTVDVTEEIIDTKPVLAGAKLVTNVNSKLEPVLNVSGTVALGDANENRIVVRVMDPDNEGLTGNHAVPLGTTVNGKPYNNYLLKAKKANEKAFRADKDCTSGKNEFTGYFLKKNKDFVEVASITEDRVILHKDFDTPNHYVNFYENLDAALSAIKGFNDKGAKYLIGLRKSTEPGYQLVLPDKAAEIHFNGMAGEKITLYNASKKNVQKIPVYFANMNVINSGTWDAKKSELILDGADVTIKGKTTLDSLTLMNGSVLRTEAATAVTDIENQYVLNQNGEENKQNRIVCAPGTLTIKGYVEDRNDGDGEGILKVVLDTDGAAQPISPSKNNAAQYVLSNESKLAVLEKETMDKFEFHNGNQGNVTDKAAWTSKGICLTANDYTNDVQVVDDSANDEMESVTRCLDMTEASNYINSLSDRDCTYRILLKNNIDDTKVTDAEETSVLTLPGKDKAADIYVLAEQPVNLEFKKDLKVNGYVGFENINLINDSFSISCEKNSDVKTGKEVIQGSSKLILDHVKADGLKNITGNKGATTVHLAETDLNLSGGVSNVVRFSLEDSKIITNAKSTVQVLTLYGSGSWQAMESTTVEDVCLLKPTGTDGSPDAYIGTYYNNKGNPQFTVTGSVDGGNIPIVIYQSNDADSNPIADGDYEDAKLILAKTESAEKFIAYPFAEYYEQTSGDGDTKVTGYRIRSSAEIVNYKDKDGYVYNGNIASKQVILGKLESTEDGEIWSNSYVSTYKEAIDIINSQGNKDAVYKVTFVKGNDSDDEDHVILESMLMPKENKAQKLIIDGSSKKLTYTGAINAACDLEFVKVTLDEIKNGESVRGIALNSNKYNVEFGENVSTIYNARAVEDVYNLEFASIKGNKGGVGFGNNKAYSYGEVNVGSIRVGQDTELYAENKVTIGDIKFADNAEFSLVGEKVITINNVDFDFETIEGAALNITTWYTKANALDKSKSQLTVKGEVDPKVAVNINPVVPHVGYDENGYEFVEYRMLGEEQFWAFIIGSAENPQTFQKVITAPKMMASENVKLIGRDCRAVRHDGGIYFTYEDIIDVIGYEEVKPEDNQEANAISYKEVFKASYLGWDMAVKEIDKLKRTDWIYDIILDNDLGGNGTPLKSFKLPSKAKEIAVCGLGDVGILLEGNKISIKCPTEFRNVALLAEAQVPLTLDSGKFYMRLMDIPNGCDIDGMGWFESKLKLTGKSTIDIQMRRYDYCDAITQISNAGNVVFYPVERQENLYGHAGYDIRDGIQKVNLLQIMPGAEVISSDSEVSVKDLYIGEASGVEKEEKDEEGKVIGISQMRNELDSRLQAKNISATGTTTMASANLKAGTMEVRDGMITLNNVVFKDNHNHIEGKQDAEGKSLISIKGSTTTEDINPGWSVATISLCLYNSAKRYAQLHEDMHIMTAPKAILSLFRPHYSWDGETNMGAEIVEKLHWTDDKGEEHVHDVYTYGFYKSDNDIRYGRLREIVGQNVIERNEVILWLGTSNPEEAGGNVPTMEYATFEEAVAAINGMPEYKEYTIEVMKDVEIGNENGDGKYKALTLPAKVSKLTIRGYNQQYIYFSGNIALKSDTSFEGINLVPMKTVKGVCEPTTTNITVGNYELSVKDARVGYWTGEPYDSEAVSCLDKISGKGRLIINEYTGMVANTISGVAVEFTGNGEGYAMDDNGTPEEDDRPVYSALTVNKSLTTKEIKFADYAAAHLQVYGKLTTDAIYVLGATDIVIGKREGSSIQIKGTTRTLENGSKETGSVFFDEVVKYAEGEDGGQGEIIERTDKILLECESANNKDVPTGTKVITGKYLNPNDWTGYSYWFSEDVYHENYRSIYLNGTDLYLGGVIATNE